MNEEHTAECDSAQEAMDPLTRIVEAMDDDDPDLEAACEAESKAFEAVLKARATCPGEHLTDNPYRGGTQ